MENFVVFNFCLDFRSQIKFLETEKDRRRSKVKELSPWISTERSFGDKMSWIGNVRFHFSSKRVSHVSYLLIFILRVTLYKAAGFLGEEFKSHQPRNGENSIFSSHIILLRRHYTCFDALKPQSPHKKLT